MLSKFYTVITNPHPSILRYIIFLLLKSQIFLLIIILIPINKFKCPIGFQLLTVLYLIFKHYSILPYISFFKKKIHMVIYISLLSIITLKEKKKHYCTHKVRMMSVIYIYIYRYKKNLKNYI